MASSQRWLPLAPVLYKMAAQEERWDGGTMPVSAVERSAYTPLTRMPQLCTCSYTLRHVSDCTAERACFFSLFFIFFFGGGESRPRGHHFVEELLCHDQHDDDDKNRNAVKCSTFSCVNDAIKVKKRMSKYKEFDRGNFCTFVRLVAIQTLTFLPLF